MSALVKIELDKKIKSKSMYTKSINSLQNKKLSANSYITIDDDKFPQGNVRMYAISFDMDIESLRQSYGDPYNNAYGEIKKVLSSHGFTRQQGSVYFGNESVNAVTCVLAVQDLSRRLPWFPVSVRDIRMLRIEENNDLLPAVQANLPNA
jgi:virulence-associated protein VapD